MSTPLPKLVAVVGPTASGKTDVALAIAHHIANLANDGGSDPPSFGGAEIIVADSRQIYRGVDVASNKTAGKWQMANGKWSFGFAQDKRVEDGERMFYVEGTPYHGLDLVEPSEVLTVSQWKQTTLQTIEGIISRKHIPIIEGGTGLYVSALLDNYDFPKVEPDYKLRAQIEKQIEDDGLESVTDELLRRDPDVTEFLDIENTRRVVRALEVIELTGKPFSEQRTKKPKLFNDLRIGIKWDSEALDRRIETRAKAYFDAGLEDEAKTMLERYDNNLPSMTSIGYLEWRDYFDGKINRDEVLLRNIKRNKKLARAQMKWFKRDKSIRWVKSPGEAVSLVKEFIK